MKSDQVNLKYVVTIMPPCHCCSSQLDKKQTIGEINILISHQTVIIKRLLFNNRATAGLSPPPPLHHQSEKRFRLFLDTVW